MKMLQPAKEHAIVLSRICKLIPGHLVSNLARKRGTDKQARTFSPWSPNAISWEAAHPAAPASLRSWIGQRLNRKRLRGFDYHAPTPPPLPGEKAPRRDWRKRTREMEAKKAAKPPARKTGRK